MKVIRLFLCIALLVIGPSLVKLANAENATQSQSPKIFLQSFYDWYTPISVKEGPLPAVDITLKEKPNVFNSVLYKGLQEDSVARNEYPGYIVGLDFDPFLASQDPCEKYVVGDVTRLGDSYKANVFGVCDGKKDANAGVIVEVVRHDSQWVIKNFYYPPHGNIGPEDLLMVLGLLKQEREKATTKRGHRRF